MYNKQVVSDYLYASGWTEDRHINSLGIPKMYSRFFERYDGDDELSLNEFMVFKPFPKLFEFWNSFGGLEIKFRYGAERRSAAVIINEIAVLKCKDYSVVQTSLHFGRPLFPVAVVQPDICFICIDIHGAFYAINNIGGVYRFLGDFFEVLDIIMNNSTVIEWEFFSKYE